MIECISTNGKMVKLHKEKFVFRPTVYAIIKNEEKLLVVKTKNERILFPGGAIEIGETIESALKREVLEETGIHVNLVDLLTVKECFLYNDVKDEAFHKICFYYNCSPISLELIKSSSEDVSPEWISLSELKGNTDKMGATTRQVFQMV